MACPAEYAAAANVFTLSIISSIGHVAGSKVAISLGVGLVDLLCPFPDRKSPTCGGFSHAFAVQRSDRGGGLEASVRRP